jgi:para-nitrobenzyl esterase
MRRSLFAAVLVACLVTVGLTNTCLAVTASGSNNASDSPVHWMCTMDSCAVNIETPNGLVWSNEGASNDGDYFAFTGIPYAASTAGENRWKPPQDPPEAWDRAAGIGSTFSSICPQDTSAFTPGFNYTMDEDCLALNVFTPSSFNASSSLPVMVWIHGGTLITGSGQGFVPQGIVSNDVVLVTINYRLGFLGYFAHPELNETNFGLLDQVKALEWVKENIENFGGDPDKVTVFGESAGGLSVLALMASPLSEGLFQSAISESAADMANAPNITMSEAGVLGVAVGEGLNISEGAGQLDKMRALPADLLVNQLYKMMGNGDQQPCYMGVANIYVDEESMPVSIVEAFESGAYHEGVNMIIGTNANETAASGDMLEMGTPQSYQSYVDRAFGSNASGVLEMTPALTDEEAASAATELTTNIIFGTPAYLVAEALANSPSKGDAYLYQFTFYPTDEKELGAYHGIEMPYVFNSSFSAFEDNATYSLNNQALADEMVTYWTNFAKTGDPNEPSDWFDECEEETCEVLPTWPKYDGSGSWQVLGDTVSSQPIPESTLQIYQWGKDLFPTQCIGGMLVGNGTCWTKA